MVRQSFVMSWWTTRLRRNCARFLNPNKKEKRRNVGPPYSYSASLGLCLVTIFNIISSYDSATFAGWTCLIWSQKTDDNSFAITSWAFSTLCAVRCCFFFGEADFAASRAVVGCWHIFHHLSKIETKTKDTFITVAINCDLLYCYSAAVSSTSSMNCLMSESFFSLSGATNRSGLSRKSSVLIWW